MFEDGDEDLFVGRTVTNSDISTAATRDEVPINLPYGRAATTQLPGKIHPTHERLYVMVRSMFMKFTKR